MLGTDAAHVWEVGDWLQGQHHAGLQHRLVRHQARVFVDGCAQSVPAVVRIGIAIAFDMRAAHGVEFGCAQAGMSRSDTLGQRLGSRPDHAALFGARIMRRCSAVGSPAHKVLLSSQ